MSSFESSDPILAIFDEATDNVSSGPFALVESLEATCRGLACEWARQTLFEAIVDADEPNRAALADWLERLPCLLAENATFGEIADEARRIWYAFPRTAMQTAVSKLFEGAAALQADYPLGYYHCVHAAFINGRIATESIPEIAVRVHNTIVSRSRDEQPPESH